MGTTTTNASLRLMRMPDVLDMTGMSKALLYKRIAAGLFPKPVHIGGRTVAWPEGEVLAVNAALIRGEQERIREIVCQLMRDRQQAA